MDWLIMAAGAVICSAVAIAGAYYFYLYITEDDFRPLQEWLSRRTPSCQGCKHRAQGYDRFRCKRPEALEAHARKHNYWDEDVVAWQVRGTRACKFETKEDAQ